MYNKDQNVTNKPQNVKQHTTNNNFSKNNNPFNAVQNKSNPYAYHQHAYDLKAYAEMVAGGKSPEEALNALVYFYTNIFRVQGAENK